MTKITFYQNSAGQYLGFDAVDHAGYAEEGSDLVCAAVSVLVINTINSVEQLTEDVFQAETDESEARISFRIPADHSKEAELLLRSLALGLTKLESEEPYQDFIDLIFEEV